jgi:sulfhydrogenase subunit beta (sulfur reductase)
MSSAPPVTGLQEAVLEADQLDRLLGALRSAGYELVGPVARDGAIVHEPIQGAADLPAGWVEDQAPGQYRLRREGTRLFGHTVGPSTWKRFLHPPRVRLFTAKTDNRTFSVVEGADPARPTAFVGVRPCDVAALAVLDRVMLGGPFPDPIYRERRENTLIVAAHCTRAAATCFCESLGTGPRARTGFDIALTEVQEAGRHYFVLESGSPRGADLLAGLNAGEPGEGELAAVEREIGQASGHMGRKLDTADLPARLRGNPEHPQWEKAAARCLACGNCTQVCPTCF